jgi:hypothetical protein
MSARCHLTPKKARFKNEHQATQRASLHGLSVYLCPGCKGWHLTKQSAGTRPVRIRPVAPSVLLGRAERALASLRRSGVTGPLLDAAIENVRKLGGKP